MNRRIFLILSISILLDVIVYFFLLEYMNEEKWVLFLLSSWGSISFIVAYVSAKKNIGIIRKNTVIVFLNLFIIALILYLFIKHKDGDYLVVANIIGQILLAYFLIYYRKETKGKYKE